MKYAHIASTLLSEFPGDMPDPEEFAEEDDSQERILPDEDDEDNELMLEDDDDYLGEEE